MRHVAGQPFPSDDSCSFEIDGDTSGIQNWSAADIFDEVNFEEIIRTLQILRKAKSNFDWSSINRSRRYSLRNNEV